MPVVTDPPLLRLTPFQTEAVALALIGSDRRLTETLVRTGSCDLPYALLALRDGYGSAGGDGNPVLDYLAEMGMATRRLMHVVFLSAGVRAHDVAAAFARSVNLVLHVNDLPHLSEALKRSREETEQAHRVLLESLRALEKA